jgi:capsular polysaccharide biosynthesis protein
LNEADILEYILSRYNVTVRITTFEEPMLEVIQLMGSTDVLIGMHGAGWTNAIFLKPGAAALQLHPYGWYVERHGKFNTIRGTSYKNIVTLLGGSYGRWVNPYADHAFIRTTDYKIMTKRDRAPEFDYAIHPEKHWEHPMDQNPGNVWVYQNTLVSVEDVAPVLDALMEVRGILPMEKPMLL